MNKIALANALKSVFGNSVTTASYFPTCADAAGTPGGVISAANLASVLGGINLFSKLSMSDDRILTGKSVLDINEGGIWQISGAETQEAPDTGYYYCYVYGTNKVKIVMAVHTRLEKMWVGCIRDAAVTWHKIF